MPCWVSPPRPSSQRSLLAGTPAPRRSKPPRPTRRCWPHTPQTASKTAPSTQSLRSSPPCSFPAAELLMRRPGRASQLGSSFAEAASFATCIWRLLSLLRWPTATTRSAADQDTATASSIAAALLSYYTIAQVDGLLTGKLGVTEAALALQIAVRFPDDGGADEVVAAIAEQILGPTDVSLSNWTVRPSSGCSVTAGVSVDGYTLTLAAKLWNIARTYNLTPGRELLFACQYRLGTASNFVVYMSEADNVYDPLYGSFVGDQGAWSTAKMYFIAAKRSGEAALRCALPGAGPAQPDGWNGGRLRPPDPGRNPGDRQHGEFLDGGTGAASVGLLSSATGITGSTLTINNTANAGNFTTVGDVSTGTLTASGAATAASFAATGALTGATLTISGAASAARWTARAWTAPSRPRAAECRRAAWSAAT